MIKVYREFHESIINLNATLMKTSATILAFLLILVLGSCYDNSVVGPQGPAGPQGPTGPQGAQGESGYVFEWQNIDFTASNNYQVILSYPNSFEGLDSDVALVYLLWDTYTNNSGETVDVWRPLNQTMLTENGTLLYKFDYSKYDVRLFLESDFSKDLLGAIDTDNWVARVVVVPGNFVSTGRVDIGDYDAVTSALGLPDLGKVNQSGNRRK